MKRSYKRSVTLKDLAKHTGYSINTVSRALRGKDDISRETIEKIKQAADELGYINNTIASSLKLGYTNTIAVILGDISNPHFAIMTKEIENYARQHGYTSFLLNTNEDSEIERKAILTAINKNVDGIIICPAQQDDSNIQFLIDLNIPFIQIGRYSENLDADYVVCDDINGGYLATRCLIDHGHERILFLNGPSYISSARERYAGYLKALEESGLPLIPELVKEVSVFGSNCAEKIEELLSENIEFTGIFAFSDIIAWQAWTYLHMKGFKIPRDFSLVGYDHIQSRMAIPFQLTTINSYKAYMSITAVDCLLEKMKNDNISDGKSKKTFRHVIKTELITGETVKKLRKK